MRFKGVEIEEKDDGIVVDLYPGMLVPPVLKSKPYEDNLDAKVDYGEVSGKIVPVRIYYPKSYTVEDIVEKEKPHEKIVQCSECERRKREILKRLRDVASKAKTPEEKRRMLRREVDRIKAEYSSLRNNGDEENVPETKSPEEPMTSEQGTARTVSLVERIIETQKEINKLLEKVFTPPDIMTPDQMFNKAIEEMNAEKNK